MSNQTSGSSDRYKGKGGEQWKELRKPRDKALGRGVHGEQLDDDPPPSEEDATPPDNP